MSADDFQTKYASVMESMLKSAVAETTKLFETMVDELKAEILKLKTENEDLRTRCNQFEKTKSQAHVYTRESEPISGASDGFERRDTAVQCDLVPLRTMLVEQCQPLRDSPLQNQEHQWRYEEMEYGLQEHNYVSHRGADSQMAYIQVKEEDDDDSCLQSVLKQEEDEPPVVSGQVVSDKAGSPTSACGTESKGLYVNQEFSTGDIPLPQKDEETVVALELCSMEIDNSQQGVQNQSSEPEHSLVISLAAVKDNIEEQSGISLKISEIGPQAGLISSDDHQLVVSQHQSDDKHLEKDQSSVVSQHCQREGEVSVNERTDVTLQQNGSVHCVVEQLAEPTLLNKEVANEAPKTRMAVGESNSQPVRRKRGRPPKKAKRLQQPVKGLQPSSITTEQEMVTSSSVSLEEVQVSSAVDKSKKTSSIITQSVQDRVNAALEENADNQVGSLPVSEVSLAKGCSSNKDKTSESQIFMEMEDAESQTPFNEVSSASKTMNTPQTPSLEAKHHHTSATLQDAMLLVEAMNQSTAENALSSPQKMAVVPQTKCAPLVSKLQTVDEILAKPVQTALLHEIADKLPVTELSTSKLSKETHNAATKNQDTAPNEAQAHLTGFIPNQQHVVTFPRTTTLPVPLLSAATQTSVGSVQQHTLVSVTPRKLSNTAPQKVIVIPRSSSLMPQKIAALSPTQLPAVVSTVVTRNTSLLPASTAGGLPLETPSLSSGLQKTIYFTSRKLLPVASPSRTTSRDQQSKIIIIPRQSQSQTFVLTAKQDSVMSPSPVTVASPQLSCSSPKLKASDVQTTSVELATSLSQNKVNTSDNLESPKQTTSDPVKTNALTETSLTGSDRQSAYALPVRQLSAMVRLTRLPFTVSPKKPVLVSRLISNDSFETQSILKESATEKISTQPTDMPVLSTDICYNEKETSIAVSVNTRQMSEEPCVVKNKMSASTKMSTILEGSQNGNYLEPSTSSSVPAPVISVTEPSSDQPTFTLDKEIISSTVQNCTLTNYPPVEKQSAASIQLTAVTSKDTCDPHLQMTKTQFLAQLAVSPIVQDPDKDSAKSSAGDTACGKQKLQKTSLVARLRSHLKTHSQIRRAEAESCLETETNAVSPKKLETKLDNEDLIDNTTEPMTVSPKNAIVVEDLASLNETTYDPTPVSPLRSGLCKNDVRSKRSVSEPTTASSKRSKDIGIMTSSGTGIGSKTKKSSSVSPKRFSSTKESTSLKNTNSISVSPRRTGPRDGTSPKNTKSSSLSPRRTNSAKDDCSPKNTKLSCVTPKRASTVKDGASPKNTKSTCVSPRRTCPSPPKTKCDSVSPRMSKSTSHRRSTFTKATPNTKQVKNEPFSPRRFSVTTDGALTRKAKSETVSPTATWLCKDGVSRKRTLESTSAKKPRLSQNGTSSTKNLRVVNAKKLTKAAKVKTIAKMKMSKQKLQNGAKTSQLGVNQANCEAVKKCTSKAIWIPPRMPITKTPKKETKSPDNTAVYPPSLTVHPIPVKAPPIVSPLQPLLVIGGHLLKNQCGECGRILSSSAALESHVGLHAGRRPFSCTLCGKSFPDSKGLKRHGRVHRNGRIHVCPQCGKGFVYRFGLTKHLQMVHGRLKPFVCQICNKGFYTKRDVEAHIRIHTGEKPFHCNLCEKKFTRRVELNVHLRWHNGEKRHWCPYCGKGFLDFNNLKRHKYIHTGEKPHSCPHCSKRFTQSGHLKKHVKNVHKIE